MIHPPETVRRLAPAKLNLRLRVLQRDETGYHGIETLLVALDLSDRVSLVPGSAGIELEVDGDSSGVPADSSNLCWRAVESLCEAAGIDPAVSIQLEKRIPSAAGLGGGSSDAAATLVALNEMLGLPLGREQLLRIAGELGSDVPFGLVSSPLALGWERGRRLIPLRPPSARPVLIAVPPFGVSASDAYRWLAADREAADPGSESAADTVAGFVLPPPEALAEWDILEPLVCNDLEDPVFRRHPELCIVRDGLLEFGAALAFLCGSGSCVAGIFDSEEIRDRAATELEQRAGVRAIRTATKESDRG
jgi:4-diphosphocytidyl-2-C-methyl-D-erythritol kinase